MNIERKLGRFQLSEFHRTVLLAVCAIPKGETRSYKQIAEQIGRPNSCRAVGTALKKNPLPLIVPCHRVIRSDGQAGRYRFGTKRKGALLKNEGVRIIGNRVDGVI